MNDFMKFIFDECNGVYSWDNEDDSSYTPGWSATLNESMREKAENHDPWVYRKASELRGFPYWGHFNNYWGGGEY